MIEARMLRTIAEHRLIRSDEHVLVACSGGADSMALTLALSRQSRALGIHLSVASIDHGLRPASASEVDLVRGFAAQLKLPFFALKLALDQGAAVQQRAREARYAALQGLRADIGANCIATGHTFDDQAETVLARLLRGSGLQGLRGIDYRRSDSVVRPLLDCRRQALRRYAESHRLNFVDDPSNDDTRFERVRLRQSILPMLLAEDAGIAQHLVHLAADARDAHEALSIAAQQALLGLQPDDPRDANPPERAASVLAVEPLLALPTGVRRQLLSNWVTQRVTIPPGRAQMSDIDTALAQGGEVLLSQGWTAVVELGQLRLSRQALEASS